MNKENTEPTKEDLQSPEFNVVWNAIKGWDIQRDNMPKGGYTASGATGTDVMTILNALRQLPFTIERAEQILFKHWQNWYHNQYEHSEPLTIEMMKEDSSFEQLCLPAMEEYAKQFKTAEAPVREGK